MTLAARGAVFVDQRDGRLDQFFGQFLRVADGGGGEDELRICAVKGRHAFQAPDDIGHVRAEDPAIGVQFVDDHEFQVAEEVGPVGVMGQDTGVQHVGIGQQDAGVLADGRAVALWGCRRRKLKVRRAVCYVLG